ncbi:hypothetical protein DFJ74DRAFT_701824 [Hyaloraphidium curvatum]|nr:hypothetical protein DFJ74DRAFT_701824 [Hyaloraphidium curvatum]
MASNVDTSTNDERSVDSESPLIASDFAAADRPQGDAASGAAAPDPAGPSAPKDFPWSLRLERDYIHGDVVQYTADFPPLLSPYLPADVFESVVAHVNCRLLELDRPTTASVVEGLVSWLTLGLSDLWRGTPRFWIELDKLREYLRERSEEWAEYGLSIVDPKETAWQFVSLPSVVFVYLT